MTQRQQSTAPTGVPAIIHAFITNPVAAAQIIGVVFTLTGVYYAITSEIKDTKAATDRRIEKIDDRVTANSLDNSKQWSKIENIQVQAEAHHSEIVAKISGYEVSLARMTTTLEHLSDQIKQRAGVLDTIANKVSRPRP